MIIFLFRFNFKKIETNLCFVTIFICFRIFIKPFIVNKRRITDLNSSVFVFQFDVQLETLILNHIIRKKKLSATIREKILQFQIKN